MANEITTGSAAHPEKKMDSDPARRRVARPDNTITTMGTPKKSAGLAHPVNMVWLSMAIGVIRLSDK
jgi:hypothetical protein